MRLVTKVDMTLLPLITLIFVLCGISVYQTSRTNTYDAIKQWLARDLQSLDKEVRLEIRTYQSILSEALNSAEMTRYVNEKDHHYQTFSLDTALYKMLQRTYLGKEVSSLHILNESDGVVLDYTPSKDPFRPQQFPTDPFQFVDRMLSTFKTSDTFSKKLAIYETDSGELNLLLSRMFSSRLLAYDDFATPANGYLVAIQIAKINSLAEFSRRLENNIGVQIRSHFKPVAVELPLSDSDITIVQQGGDIRAVMNSSFFQLELLISCDSVDEYLISNRQLIMFVVIAASLVSFILIRMLFLATVVNPINRLHNRIHDTPTLTTKNFELLPGDDEVSKLNNAYLKLLVDLQHLASFDTLTGLPNRRSFEYRLNDALNEVTNSNQYLALLFIDLDNFKWVNDHFGHVTGDRLLKEFGLRLKQVVVAKESLPYCESGAVARFAGDEFAVLLTKLPDADTAKDIAGQILSEFENGFYLDGVCHQVQASIGIALTSGASTDLVTIFKSADAAMYRAKAEGRNRYVMFDQSIAADVFRRQLIEDELNKALVKDGFELAYMPIYDMRDSTLVGYEVLLRCKALAKLNVGPDVFIPIAESSGLIKRIDQWVLENALAQYQKLKDDGFLGFVSVNISSVELKNDNFVPLMARLVDQFNVPSGKLYLELTETRLLSPDSESIATLKRLRELGLLLSLDDFGTGYTAFSQLTHYPVDCIKIDRTFVSQIDDFSGQSIVNIILAISEIHGLQVIAEGIETQLQQDYLLQRDCILGQGYLLSKPISHDEFVELVSKEVLLPTTT
ncbi:putative bifunctional diguanylate cyclase/phosphodiesterase [Vibrio hangzhouensis]|uniref:putative bifunctional diguanylate cyclase/phosphodiesterase n=1 Tax=Vibrio hangzhouensis TaxID=462991 RepID=UPI001C983E70|nr:EAL domain-containing protein [Vibrio hangzhouensis]MBY6196494.1 EAL domain-containing protein [Vibrio hangzhouensis]